jgi:hypothetical protein
LWRRWELPIGVALVALALLFSLYLMQSGNTYTAVNSRGTRGAITFFSLLGAWIIHAVVVVRATIAGVTVISREHVGQTWDAMVLTGVSVRRIMFGKLRAALRPILPWMLLLAVLRTVLLPLLSYFYVQRFALRCVSYTLSSASGGYGTTGYASCGEITWVAWAWLAAPLLTVALTMLEVVACVSLGIAASAITRRSVPAAILAITVRFLPIAAFIGFAIYEVGDTWFFRYLRYSPFTIADGGMAGVVQLINPLHYRTIGVHERALPGLLGIALVLGTFMVGSWLVAIRALRHSGALSEEQIANSTIDRAYAVYRAG